MWTVSQASESEVRLVNGSLQVEVTRWDRIMNEEIRRRAEIEETLREKVDRKSVSMVWALRKNRSGALTWKGQSSYCKRSPEERKVKFIWLVRWG